MRALVMVLLSGCIAGTDIGPGAVTSMRRPHRPLEPTEDPTKTKTAATRTPETGASQPGTRAYMIERGLATIAAIMAGAIPVLSVSGTFDENRLGPKPALPPVKRKAQPLVPDPDWWPPKSDGSASAAP